MSRIRETNSERRERGKRINAILEKSYPDSEIALTYESPFQLMVATILSAQCTDARVNTVTPALFAAYPTPQAFLEAPMEDIERAIFSTGYYRNKARSIKGASAALLERFGGEVPGTMEELLTLPGVGRKTANVVLGHCFSTPGMVVDTHVKRIANLLGLVDSDDPVKIESQLMEVLPQEKWVRFSHLLAEHGRAVCIARRPKCDICPVAELCPSAGIGWRKEG